MAIESLRHKVDAKHIQNLGQNSVSDRHQAILEIAKNSYDADAEAVKVTLHGRTAMAGEQYIKIHKITIYDNGNGMTYRGPEGQVDAHRHRLEGKGDRVSRKEEGAFPARREWEGSQCRSWDRRSPSPPTR